MTCNLPSLRALALTAIFPVHAIAAELKIEDYPMEPSIQLGTVSSRVTPKREVIFTAPITAELSLLLPPSTTEVSEGTAIAEMDAELVLLEEQIVDLTEKLLLQKELPELSLANEQNITQIENEISRIRTQNTVLKKLRENPELASTFIDPDLLALDGEPKKPTPAQLGKLIERNQSRLKKLIEHRKTMMSSDYQTLETDLRKAKIEQQKHGVTRRAKAASFTAPFDGKLEYLLRVGDDQKIIPVRAGDDILRVQDLTGVHAEVAISRETWRSLREENLQFVISTGGKQLRSQFYQSAVRQISNREELIYTFAFKPEEAPIARGYIGGITQGELHYVLPKPAYIVPKLDIVMAAEEAFREGGWSTAIQTLFPNQHLLIIGEAHVAISAKQP